MFDAGASGVCGVRSATTVPLSTSTTCRLASELRPVGPFIKDCSRSPSVAPTAVPAIDGAAATALPFLRVTRRRFFAAAASSGVTANNAMTVSRASSLRIRHPCNDGRQLAEGRDRGVGMDLHVVLDRWCDSHAAFRRDEVHAPHPAALRAVDIDVEVVAD